MAGDPSEVLDQSPQEEPAAYDETSGGASSAQGVYCNRCGYLNDYARGACLMCLDMLHDVSGGQGCQSCGTDNPKAARFCGNCGATLDLEAVAVPTRQQLAERVLEAVGDIGVDVDDDDEYIGGDDEYGDDAVGAFDESEDFAAAGDIPPEGAKPAAVEVPAAAIPGDIIDTAEPDEDFAMPPPGVVEEPAPEPVQDLEVDMADFAPPPPPGIVEEEVPVAGAVDLDEDDFAPPPPPGMVAEAEEDDFAPPPPPPGTVAEADEDEFAPPPPPPGMVAEADEDEFAPPPPPPGAVAEDAPPPPPPPAAEEKATNGNFDGWSLEEEAEEEEEE